MGKEKLKFKGINGKLYIEVEAKDLDDIIKYFKENIVPKIDFYKDAKIDGIKSNLNNRENLEFLYFLKYKYNIEIGPKVIDLLIKNESEEEKEVYIETIFLNRTVRSGQKISNKGSIIIIGDVNPGAIIESGSNIIVLGALRGLAYAGKGGNLDSFIAAYQLKPTQLRIGEKIARAPDKSLGQLEELPEIARIIDGNLVIEPYLPNK